MNIEKKGIIVCILTSVAFSVLFAIVKHLSSSISPIQIAFFRSFFGLLNVIIIAYISKRLNQLIPRKDIFLLFCRSVTATISICIYIYGTSLIAFADFTALSFVNPLIVAIFSLLFLKEKIPSSRWFAIISGFIGVLIIAKPGNGIISSAAVVIILGCIIAASSDTFAKMLTNRGNKAITIVGSLSFFGTIVLGMAVPFFWTTPNFNQWIFLILLGISGTFAQLLLNFAFELCPASLVAAFAYTSLFWSILIGAFFFNEMPTGKGLIGSMFILVDAALALYSFRKMGIKIIK